MNRLFAFFLACGSLLLGTGLSAQAQHGRGHHDHHDRGHHGHGPRYHHEAPYRSYGGRNYYRPRSGPAIVIRP